MDPAIVRRRLAALHGQVWDSFTLVRDFDVIRFTPPLVHVCRRSDGAMGSVTFQHVPRFYWGWHASG